MLSRRLKEVIRLRLQKTSSRHLQDVLIKTNILALLKCFQKTSSRSLDQDQYVRLGHTSSRRLQDVSRKRLQDALQNTSSRHLQDVFKSFSRCLQDVFKTSSRLLAKTSSRRLQKQNVFKRS